jgi:transposase-like protein
MKIIAKKDVKMDMDMIRLMENYNNEDACREHLEHLRWQDGVVCPRCRSRVIRNSYTRNQFDCGSCGYKFSVTTGTIFQDTHLPLQKWFVAIYLMIESKKGIFG